MLNTIIQLARFDKICTHLLMRNRFMMLSVRQHSCSTGAGVVVTLTARFRSPHFARIAVKFGVEESTKFLNINAPQGLIYCTIFTKLYNSCAQFHVRLAFKIWGFAQGALELWGLKLRGAVPPLFLAPLNSETFQMCKNVPKVL